MKLWKSIVDPRKRRVRTHEFSAEPQLLEHRTLLTALQQVSASGVLDWSFAFTFDSSEYDPSTGQSVMVPYTESQQGSTAVGPGAETFEAGFPRDAFARVSNLLPNPPGYSSSSDSWGVRTFVDRFAATGFSTGGNFPGARRDLDFRARANVTNVLEIVPSQSGEENGDPVEVEFSYYGSEPVRTHTTQTSRVKLWAFV